MRPPAPPSSGSMGRCWWTRLQYTTYVYYTLFIVHYTLYIVHYTLYKVHYTLYTMHYILFTVHYTLYTLHTIHSTLHTAHYTQYSRWLHVCPVLPAARPRYASVGSRGRDCRSRRSGLQLGRGWRSWWGLSSLSDTARNIVFIGIGSLAFSSSTICSGDGGICHHQAQAWFLRHGGCIHSERMPQRQLLLLW